MGKKKNRNALSLNAEDVRRGTAGSSAEGASFGARSFSAARESVGVL